MAETGMAGQTVALAAVLAAGTFLLYFLKHLLDAVRAWHDEQRRSERLVCALYAEIEANLRDLQAFLDDSASLERTVYEGGAPRPRQLSRLGHDLVYDTHLGELASLPRAVIYKVVSFYAHQARLAAALERVEAMSEAELDEQRGALRQARQIAEEGVSYGKEVLHGLEVNAPMDLVNSALRRPAGALRAEPA